MFPVRKFSLQSKCCEQRRLSTGNKSLASGSPVSPSLYLHHSEVSFGPPEGTTIDVARLGLSCSPDTQGHSPSRLPGLSPGPLAGIFQGDCPSQTGTSPLKPVADLTPVALNLPRVSSALEWRAVVAKLKGRRPTSRGPDSGRVSLLSSWVTPGSPLRCLAGVRRAES